MLRFYREMSGSGDLGGCAEVLKAALGHAEPATGSAVRMRRRLLTHLYSVE